MTNALEKLHTLLFAMAAILIVTLITFSYIQQVDQDTFDECASHIREVYKQVTKSFVGIVIQNWQVLNDWNRAIQGMSTDADIDNYLNTRRKFWNFWEFFFIAEDGSYLSIDGDRGKFNFTNSFNDDMLNFDKNKKSVFFEEMPALIKGIRGNTKSSSIAVAMIATKRAIYKGFEYTAIGVGYFNEDIVKILSIDSFDGRASTFVVSSNGLVVLSTKAGENIFKNYLLYLEHASNLNNEEILQIKKEWQPFTVESTRNLQNMRWRGKTRSLGGQGTANVGGLGLIAYKWGVVKCKVGKEQTFICYHNMNYGGFVVLGVVNDKVAGSRARKIQKSTIVTLIEIFIVFLIFMLVQLHKTNKRQRQKSAVALKYKELLFDILSTNVDDIFILVDGVSGRGEYVSPNVTRLLGLKLSGSDDYENVTQTIMQTAASNLKPTTKNSKPLENANSNGAANFCGIDIDDNYQWNCEHTNYATGEKRYYRESVYHVNIQETNKYVFVLSDRTQEREMMQKMDAALTVAKNANNAKSNFLSNMSHDIRTPMNAITGFTLLLDKNANDENKVHEYTKKITSAATLLLELINNVLDMSKIESGKTQLTIEPFEIQKVLDDVYTVNSEAAHAKAQFFELHKIGNLNIMLMGDKLRVSQIFTNLISNAIKYTPTGGIIDFTVERLTQIKPLYAKLRFTVKDNGIGMSKEFMKTLYEPFMREKTKATNKIQGTGLGMAITKNFVDLMGGVINVKSVTGEGTTFTVELSFPLATNKSTKVEIFDNEHGDQPSDTHNNNLIKNFANKINGDKDLQNEPNKLNKNGTADNSLTTTHDKNDTNIGGLHFLIAEDNVLNAEILQELLKMKGATFETADNGKDVCDIFAKAPPRTFDAILMDVQMPIMDGLEATRNIRMMKKIDSKTIPIIAMTANAFEEDIKNALDAGMNAHISKPIDLDAMCKTIIKLTKKHTQP